MLDFRPLTQEHWTSLEQLFGRHGAIGGCWCMWWRQTQGEFQRQRGDQNRLAFKALVGSGTIPGILAYEDEEPVGWCAIEPRESYPRLERSKTLARVDDRPVWSLTCFYIAKDHRGKGVMGGLVGAAVEWAGENGAHIVEAYPMELREGARVSGAYMGLVPAFLKAGFVEVERRSERRPIVRKHL